jgi:PQQ-dependent catabolism-associated CXXCW motif protein
MRHSGVSPFNQHVKINMPTRQPVRNITVLLLALLLGFCAQAMTLVVQGNTVFATGTVGDDYRKFVDALDNPAIEQIVFVNSPGGDLWTGMRVGRLVVEKGLKTVVAGFCSSACSLMFMGGKTRTFADTFRPTLTYVGIHGPHFKQNSEVAPQLATQLFAFYKSQMGERFHVDVMNKALFEMDDAGSLFRVFDAYRFPKRVSYHCKSEQTLRKDCTEFPGEDAYTLGVVTSIEMTPVDLPQAFKSSPRIAGAELTVAVADPDAWFKELSAAQCKSDACKKTFAEFATYPENKALAIPLHDMGHGMANNRDSLSAAFNGALYFCNHVKDKPARLCETQVVNGYDVRNLYVQGELSHAKALEQLQPPPQKFYANEEYGGGFTSAQGLRVQKVHDITPARLDGIQTVGTQELALLLKSPQPPVVVDVWAGADESIPGAVTLLSGGIALDDPIADAAYEARFLGLLRLLSPDMAKPLVFYCMSRDCWLSVNAAMRARKLGYAKVAWYRGGWASWKAANLPTAQVVVRAVVH